MNFPIMIPLLGWELHPHLVFEMLAYFIGFRVYLFTRNKDKIPFEQSIWVVVGAERS
ncbi:hypothetical protein [Bacillus solimangrovi]|uniref:hypothetical protein n=1 Tax=Bacillus solimangrovi TaxID=1305675 RepID=UPI00158653D4|nr:hypothetical protein [Bacillus solimangrovi]